MATVSNPIILKITNAGKLNALSPNSGKVQLSVDLTHIAIGSGRYTATGNEIGINSLISKIDTVAGDIDVATNTLHFSATIYANKPTPVYELGLLDSAGGLFAIAASLNTPLFTIYPNVAFVVAFGISLNEATSGSVTVTISPNNSLMPAIMQNHLTAPNPHPQYLNNDHLDVSKDPHPQYVTLSRFQLLLDTAFPVGYLHHTHDAVNPKPQFDALLGIATAWRRLAGRIIVGIDPADPYIQDVGLTIGQKGMTSDAGINRPHVYPLHTTNIFERYNPDDAIETVWRVSADKTSIDEGAAIRFTVTANNVPDGQILRWTVKEGALNDTSNDITAPDKNDTGTVILKNGTAVIDFVTSPDDNIAESQKYVRLTIGAPANLSINVPIIDAGRTETVVHISSTTDKGVILDEYYKQHSGSYAASADTIRFIVDYGVDIIAPNVKTPALQAGLNWPAATELIVENRGRILGRGGDGGRSAYYHAMWNEKDQPQYDVNFNYSRPAEAGGDGGTAIKGKILVENYGVIAGGGGGGGGLGLYAKTGTKYYFGGGGTGGGAPFGKRSPNESTYSMYLIDDRFPNTKAEKVYNGSTRFSEIFHRVNGAYLYHVGNYQGPRVAAGASNWQETRAVFIEMDINNPRTHAADGFKTYKIDASNNYSGREIISIPLTMSQDATLELAGNGGANLLPNMYHDDAGVVVTLSASAGTGSESVTANTRGGNGGSFGEQGEGGVTKILLGFNGSTMSPISNAETTWRQASAAGGRAGFVKEGDVVINNFAGGSAKGR